MAAMASPSSPVSMFTDRSAGDVESKAAEPGNRSTVGRRVVPGELHSEEGYKVIIEGCARVFRFRPDVLASQSGTLFLTHFRLRFVPKPCRCGGQVRGPPEWHNSSCTMKGPVSPWGSYVHTWPPPSSVLSEITRGVAVAPDLLSDSTDSKPPSHAAETPLFFVDVPVMAIRRASLSSRELRVVCRDGRVLEFELSSDQEGEGLMRLLGALAFPKDDVMGAFAFQTRYRAGLGWDVFDAEVDANRALLSRTRVALKRVQSPCETYPKYIYIPEDLPDADVQGSATFRSMGRLPVPVWAHPRNGALLVRSAQPLVGLLGNRSPADERLVRALCGSAYLLLDARSRAAALGNRAMGKGTESIERGYEGALELTFCDLGNIHHLKTTAGNLQRFFSEPPREATWGDVGTSSPYNSPEIGAWLTNVAQLLKASMRIVQAMDAQAVSAWTHCSDGWDRTSQMCALAQMVMDPDYRTRIGFAAVLEKNFAQFGFKFRERGRGMPSNSSNSSSASSTPRSTSPAIIAIGLGSDLVYENDEDESSPVLLLFIDCVYQLLMQFPDRFEFNETFLVGLADAYHSGRFGTFLCNSEKERLEKKVNLETRSVWDWLCLEETFRNPSFSPYGGVLNANTSLRAMRLFERYWARYDCHKLENPAGNSFY